MMNLGLGFPGRRRWRRIFDPRTIPPVASTEFLSQAGNGTTEQFRTSDGQEFYTRA